LQAAITAAGGDVAGFEDMLFAVQRVGRPSAAEAALA
jgi:hypothetical protein